jgi:phosphate transport system permease protein
VLGVILPAARAGIVTATVLAIARAAGETAPLLIVDSLYNQGKATVDVFGQAVPNIPVQIFQLSESPDGLPAAWGAAFVLLFLILMANIGARAWLARSQRKLTR